MDVSIEHVSDRMVVAVVGRLDTTSAPQFDARLALELAQTMPPATASKMAEARRRILLDMVGTTYVSSAGLRSILQLVKHTASQGGRLGIFGATPHVMEVIEISGFPTLLDLYADRAAALAD
jgi:anti-anti-sigma factor